MRPKRALITGISGQDGSYLAELLLDKGYEVWGTVKRNSVAENQTSRINHIIDDLNLVHADVTDMASLTRALQQSRPLEIYNLAAQSHVRISFDQPIYTTNTIALGTLNMLEAMLALCPDARYYNAGSSEQFGLGVDEDNKQRETTSMVPVSPYGCAKVYAYNLVRNYRISYSMHCSNGILFNHESPRRGSNFVTAKVVKAAVAISEGKQKTLALGNLDAVRDWGHAKDYVRGMWMIAQQDQPLDLVLATGKTHSVRDLCKLVFSSLHMDYKDYIVFDARYTRREELPYLQGDASKAKTLIDWEPEISFESLIEEMIEDERKASMWRV